MSLATPPPAAARPRSGVPAKAGADQLIEERINEACTGLWWAELTRTVLRMVVFSIAALLLWVLVDQWIYSPGQLVRLAVFMGFTSLLAVYLYRRLRPLLGSTIRPEYAARSLERDMPELRHSLTSYVTLRGDRDAGDLRSRVVRSIGAEAAGRLRGHDALPMEATGTMQWWVATACALAVLVVYAALSPKSTLQSAARLAAPIASIEPPHRVSIREVQPGNVEAIAGRSVEISAEIKGLRDSEEAICFWELPSSRHELPLEFDPESRRHLGQLQLPHSADGIVRYSIAAGDATAGPFELTVQDVPVVALQSVHYTPPRYTGQSPYSSSSGAITAVDGTTVKISANTNRPVAKAKIEFNPRVLGDVIQATAGATELEIDSEGTGLSVTFPVRSAQGRSAAVELQDYRILVWDASGQGNPEPIVYPIRVVADLPPEVAITVPASSPKELPIDAQQVIEVHASDPDYGLRSVVLEIRAGLDRPGDPLLWSSERGETGHRVAEYPLRPAALNLRIGDTVQVVAIATDNRTSEIYPNVEPNVVRTDPVTLKITAGGVVPEQNDPNADGLSNPDEASQPEREQSSEQGSSDSGNQPAGGGGSGGDPSSTGEQNPGDSGGEGTGSQKNGAESENDASGDGTGGESASNKPGSNSESSPADPSSGNDSSEGDSSEGETNQGESGSRSEPQADAGDERQPADAGQSNTGEGGQSDTGEGGQSDTGEGGQSDTGEGGQSDTGEGGQSDAGEGGANPAGNAASETRNSAGDSTDSQTDSSAGKSSTGDSAAGEPKQAPKHDGEAFERIQEYLEKNRERGSEGSRSESPSPSDSQNSDSQNSDSQNSDSQNSDSQNGAAGQDSTGAQSDQGGEGSQETKATDDDQGVGSQSKSPRGQGTSGDQGTADADRSQSATTDDASGANGETGSSEGQATSGESSSGESSSGESSSGESSSGESSSGEGAGQSTGEEAASDQTAAGSDPREGSTATGSGNQAASQQSRDSGAPNTTAAATSGGAGDSGDEGDAAEQAEQPPDPVNVEYAKRATDLVLDYLEQTREAPDPKLLEDLQWSQQDLQNFAERWRQVRELSGPNGAQTGGEVEEALKSLGLRPKQGGVNTTRESGDELRGMRDSGNRKPPPAAFRDAFDAFRRAVAQ